MNRESDDYLRDILEAMRKSQLFVENLSYKEFRDDDKTIFAVVRAIEIIGETMTNVEDLRRILHAHKEELNRRYGVSEIGIFGSFVKNEQDDTSDVDILVEFDKPIDLLNFVNLKNYLSDLLNIKVDLVMKKALKPKIGERILKETVNI